MGGRARRDAALTPALAETLAAVATAMATARDDWWIIGSAAVALHGAAVTVADVDVLCSERDALAVVARLGLSVVADGSDPLFASAVFARWNGLPLAVEFMAGLHVRGVLVSLETRELVAVAGGVVAVPSREELRALLTMFGREKDLRRAGLL